MTELVKKWDKVREYSSLLWINLKVTFRSLWEFIQDIFHYYGCWGFVKADLAMLGYYLFSNPYRIHRRFLEERGAKDVYTYGETPLRSLEEIAKHAKISAKDTVFELGCGRGTSVFWLATILKCKAVGVDYVPTFIERANKIQELCKIENVEFRQEDMLSTDLSSGNVFYFYGTSSTRPFVEALIKRLKELPSGTRVITVSYPLTSYAGGDTFEVMEVFPVHYTWGEAQVYVHYRK